MTHPFELLVSRQNKNFAELLLLKAIVRLSVTSLDSGKTFSEVYDELRKQVLEDEKEARKSNGPLRVK